MVYERSCGAVVYTKTDGQIRYVLIRSAKGVWGFPKGHMESGETEEQTALREIEEEVHLKVTLQKGFRQTEEYALPGKKDTVKQVVYFCAEYADQEIIPQKGEVAHTALVPYREALRLLTFEAAKRILKAANEFILKQ